VSASEGRTVAELLDDSDGLAREALLDMSADRALGMVRGWPQLMQSAAELWAVLPPDPTVAADGDPIGILAATGRAVGRGLAAGHWPGRGPRDEAWEQVAANFVQARRLRQEQPVASEAVSIGGQTSPTTANTQMLHALYVAAHATAVTLTGYERDLQNRGQPCAWKPHWPPGKSRPTGHPRQPDGSGRSGPSRPGAGAHRHNNRGRQRSCRAARRARRRRGRKTHPSIRECPAGVEPLSTPLGGAHHGGQPHGHGPG
jgi:hypothetical protein